MSGSKIKNLEVKPDYYEVPFYPGDGTTVMLKIKYICSGGKLVGIDKRGTCAFCQGDPLGDESEPDSLIYQYFERNEYADTCPACGGRST